MTPEDETTGTSAGERAQRAAQALAITLGPAGRGRPFRSRLAERQVDAQGGDALRRERAGDRAEHRRLAIGAGAVGEDDAVARRRARPVQDATHGGIAVALLEGLELGHSDSA